MKIEKIKQEESENEAKLNDEKIARYCEDYGKLTSEEQKEITKGAEELYLKKRNVGFMSISWTQFFSFFTNIFSQIL